MAVHNAPGVASVLISKFSSIFEGMLSKREDNVGVPSIRYLQMAGMWELLVDLRAGTDAMRQASTRWLPQETAESDGAFQARLSRSFLFSAYDDTVKKLASKPFVKPVSLANSNEFLDRFTQDVDGTGTSLTDFARDVMDVAIDRGLCHILVDYPDATNVQTLEQERQLGIRPRFVLLEPDRLIGWRFEQTEGGIPLLQSIRIREEKLIPAGAYLDEVAKYIREYRRDGWTLHRYNEKDKQYYIESEGPNTLGQVPVVTVYFNGTGFMMGEPPLLDLAHLNLAHYQSLSDQRNILRFSRFALLFAKGLEDDEFDEIEIGPTRLIKSKSSGADLKYVEHTGGAITAGERDLKSLQEQMEILGLQPLLTASGGVTATGQSIDEARSHCEIQAWVKSLEAGLKNAFEIALKWRNKELPDGFEVNVFSDFVLSLRAAQDIASLITMRKNREITRKTFLEEVKRRGLLSDMLDIDEEIIAANNEAIDELNALAGNGAEESDDPDDSVENPDDELDEGEEDD